MLGAVLSGATLADALAPLREAPERSAVLLDVDGTLAPIVDQADAARVPEATRRLLVEVDRRYGLVGCVSGRRAADARHVVGIDSLHYLGTHGTELMRGGWSESRLEPDVEREGRRVREFGLGADTAELRGLGVRREDKGPIAAFHWRGAPDEAAARHAAQELAGRAEEDGLWVHWGRMVLEVRPPVRMDKGVGVVSLLGDADVDRALYAGDDRTDLDAFRGLVELRETGRLEQIVRVGVISDEGPAAIAEEADVTVDGTDGVAELLGALLARS